MVSEDRRADGRGSRRVTVTVITSKKFHFLLERIVVRTASARGGGGDGCPSHARRSRRTDRRKGFYIYYVFEKAKNQLTAAAIVYIYTLS